jgi:hypothetical protein
MIEYRDKYGRKIRVGDSVICSYMLGLNFQFYIAIIKGLSPPSTIVVISEDGENHTLGSHLSIEKLPDDAQEREQVIFLRKLEQ